MDGISATVVIIGMFLLRIGIPFLILILLGTIIEKHQNQRRAAVAQMYENQKVD